MTEVPTVTLANGVDMPALGLGTSPMNDEETEATIAAAIPAGYRLIDTAENYGNERGVGRGIRASGVDRDDVFVTTKFNERWHGFEEAQEAFANSAERLGLDRIDLLLIHWPVPKRTGTWTRGEGSSGCSKTARSERSVSPTSSRRTSTGCSRRPAWLPT
jgi:2,5-diketo-D-gluconate reductase A